MTDKRTVLVGARPDAVERRRVAREDRRLRHAQDLDWVLIAAALTLTVVGIVLVASAGSGGADLDAGIQMAQRHGVTALIGVIGAYVASRTPYHLLHVAAPWVYLVTVAFTLLPLTPLGVSVAGARAWVTLPGGFTVQPSEFAKIGMILVVAAYLAGHSRRGRDPGVRASTWAAVLASVPIGIVLVQNDTGTMLVMAATALTVIVVAGAPLRWILGVAAATALGIVAVLQLGLLQDYQMDRLTAFADPQADELGVGFNTHQARIAIGGGGLLGHGLFNGPQTQGGFVPVNESDFILTVAGEELGLLGTLVLITLIGIILARGLRIAALNESRFARLVAVGVVAWFGFQAFENIGMSLGITPVTGVTLPFVSFGGSSMIACWLAIGVLQVLHVRAMRGPLYRENGSVPA